MSSKKKKFDEFYTKPSAHREWQERGDAPVITKPISQEEIGFFRKMQADAYRVPIEEVRVKFEKIIDADDEDRTDCLWVRMFVTCFVHDVPSERNIYNIKVFISEGMRRKAEEERSDRGTHKRAPARARALPAPGAKYSVEEPTPLPTPPRAPLNRPPPRKYGQ